MEVKVLGIETSCDETAAAVVELTDDGELILHRSIVASSMDLHVLYGGVVPEIAARSHIEHMMPVVDQALDGIGWDSIDAIAVTQGPGLGGSLLVGVVTARTLAIRKNKPLYAVNHVMAHPFATFITKGPENFTLPEAAPQFPMLALIVSGGHSQLVLFQSPLEYDVLGRSRDDAVGEAFDKVAKILGLPYPGGPSIGKKAAEGDPHAYNFPKAKLSPTSRSQFNREVQGGSENSKQAVSSNTASAGRSDNDAIRSIIESGEFDFSFSGLKTAVLRLAQKEIGEDHHFPSKELSKRLSEAQKANIAASFQHGAVETLVEKTVKANEQFAPKSVVVAGGVAASPELRRQLADALPIAPIYTDMKLCTDNGAMIAALGCYMAKEDTETADPYTLDIKPTWPM